MIGLDTNILVRYILQDDKTQLSQVNKLMERLDGPDGPGFVSLPTMLEVAWVLRSRYRMSTTQVSSAIDLLLSTESLLVQNEDELFAAMTALRKGIASFEDALISAMGHWAGCTSTYTFDRKAARLPGFTLLS